MATLHLRLGNLNVRAETGLDVRAMRLMTVYAIYETLHLYSWA